MPEMLLINPAKRRRAKRRASPAQLRALAAGRAARAARSAPKRRRARRRNPVPALASVRRAVKRRRNPVARVRRRRNPINLGSTASYINLLKSGLIGGAGALAVDLAYGYVTPYLPDSLKRTPGSAGLGDAVKALATIAAGQMLNKATGGLSMTAARGALTVQAHGLLAQFLPSTMTLGYAGPARVVNMSNRVGPNTRSLARFVAPGQTPMLSRYTQPGRSPMLSGRSETMARELMVR